MFAAGAFFTKKIVHHGLDLFTGYAMVNLPGDDLSCPGRVRDVGQRHKDSFFICRTQRLHENVHFMQQTQRIPQGSPRCMQGVQVQREMQRVSEIPESPTVPCIE